MKKEIKDEFKTLKMASAYIFYNANKEIIFLYEQRRVKSLKDSDIFNQYFFFSISYHFQWLVAEKKLIFFRQIKVINNKNFNG